VAAAVGAAKETRRRRRPIDGRQRELGRSHRRSRCGGDWRVRDFRGAALEVGCPSARGQRARNLSEGVGRAKARKQDATPSARAPLLGDVCIFANFSTGKENENDSEMMMS